MQFIICLRRVLVLMNYLLPLWGSLNCLTSAVCGGTIWHTGKTPQQDTSWYSEHKEQGHLIADLIDLIVNCNWDGFSSKKKRLTAAILAESAEWGKEHAALSNASFLSFPCSYLMRFFMHKIKFFLFYWLPALKDLLTNVSGFIYVCYKWI